MTPGDYDTYEHGSDYFDELLRQAMQQNTPAVQPSSRVWERIRSQVAAGPAPASHRPPGERLSQQLAPLVQGLAAAVIVILVGVSLGTTRWDTSQPPAPPSSLVTAEVDEPLATAARVESVQRLGRFGALDDLSDDGLGQGWRPKPGSQPVRAVPTRSANGDLDRDLVDSRRASAGDSGP